MSKYTVSLYSEYVSREKDYVVPDPVDVEADGFYVDSDGALVFFENEKTEEPEDDCVDDLDAYLYGVHVREEIEAFSANEWKHVKKVS